MVQKYAKTASDLAGWIEENIPKKLTVFSFTDKHRRCLRPTKGLERLNREIRRFTRVYVAFLNSASGLFLTAIVMKISEEW